MHFRVFLVVGVSIVASGVQGQQQKTLADCLEGTNGALASFEACQAEVVGKCATDEIGESGLDGCFNGISQNLRVSAKQKIAGEDVLKTDDLGAEPMTIADYRRRLAAAAFRRADRIGQAECDFLTETAPQKTGVPPLRRQSGCQMSALAKAYWNIVVHHRYFYPKIQPDFP